MHRLTPLLYLVLLFFGWGCSESPLTLQVSFPEVSGLKQDDLVFFGESEIGQVKKISYTKQGDFLVEVRIAPPFKNTATQDSKFFIAPSPADELKMAVIVEQEHSGGAVLQNGTVVQGSGRKGHWAEMLGDLQKQLTVAQNELNKTLQEFNRTLGETSQQFDRKLSATLDALALQFKTFTEEIGKVPDSREVKQLEENIKQFTDEFQKAGKDIQDRLRNDIIPRLRMELEKLHQQLKREGREEELEKIDKQVDELYI